jgi:hypothetical protein
MPATRKKKTSKKTTPKKVVINDEEKKSYELADRLERATEEFREAIVACIDFGMTGEIYIGMHDEISFSENDGCPEIRVDSLIYQRTVELI